LSPTQGAASRKIAGFDINWNIVAYPARHGRKSIPPKKSMSRWATPEAIFAASRVDQ